MDREAPTFEEFSNAVLEDLKGYKKQELIDYFYSDEAQEMVKGRYDSYLQEYNNGEIDYSMFMNGGVSSLSYCLYYCY